MGNLLLRALGIPTGDKNHEFSEKILRLQTIQHSDTSKLFHWVQAGDLMVVKEKIDEMSKEPNFNIGEIDAAGANIVHLAYLYEWYHIGHWFVESYPELALRPYSDELPEELSGNNSHKMPYTGENILHMVIVRRNYGEVRWLLDFYKDHKDSVPYGLERLLLTSNAIGTFFDPKGDFYFGGYPLQFAACSNSIDIFDLVLSFASSIEYGNQADSSPLHGGSERSFVVPSLGPNVIFMRDSFGNTLLHLCVIHGLSNMFDHVLHVATTVISRELQCAYAEQVLEQRKSKKKSRLVDYESLSQTSGHNLRPRPLQMPAPNKFEAWLVEEIKRKVDERLLLVLNNDLFTPLTLAASLSNKVTTTVTQKCRMRMIKTVLSSSNCKSLLWSFGPLTCSDVNLRGIDMNYRLEDYDMPVTDAEVGSASFHGSPPIDKTEASMQISNLTMRSENCRNLSAIMWLCLNEDTQSVLLSEVKSIIEWKWERYGFHQFMNSFMLDISVTALVTLLTIFINSAPTFHPTYKFEWFVNILYAVVVVLYLGGVLPALPSKLRGLWNISKIQGVAKFHFFCRIIMFLSFIIFMICRIIETNDRGWRNDYWVPAVPYDPNTQLHEHLHRALSAASSKKVVVVVKSNSSSDELMYNPQVYLGSKYTLSVCVTACWLNLYFYMTGFQATGPFMLSFKNVLALDLPYFFRFYFILLVAIAGPISMLRNEGDESVAYGFLNILETIWSMMQKAVLFVPFEDLTAVRLINVKLQWLSSLLLTAFYAFVVIIMLNLLIAIIDDTYKLFASFDDSIFLIEKYFIMNFFDVLLSPANLEIERKKYCSITNNAQDNDNDETAFSSGNTKEYKFQLIEQNPSWFHQSVTDGADRHPVPKFTLFIIDPQWDYHKGGAMAVPGADEDSQRIADMIRKNKHFIQEIFVTLDSLYPYNITSATYWRDQDGNPPPPYTIIKYKDLKSGIWSPRDDSMETMEWCLSYLKALERKGKSILTIMPSHCLLGSRGHTVVASLNDAIQEWAAYSKRQVSFIFKGQNSRTEMVSAFEAVVEDSLDNNTGFNTNLMAMIRSAENVNFISTSYLRLRYNSRQLFV